MVNLLVAFKEDTELSIYFYVVNAEITIQMHIRNEFGNKDKSKETSTKNMRYCVALSMDLPLQVLFLILIT